MVGWTSSALAVWSLRLWLLCRHVSLAREAAECGVRAHVADAFPKMEMPGSLPGLECPGYAEDHTCCEILPMQKLAAWLQFSMKHDEEHLGSFTNILAHVEATLEAFANGGGDPECTLLVDQMLRPRVDAAKFLAARAREGLKLVEHLTISSLCAYCFDEEKDATFRLSMQDGPAAEQLSALGAETQQHQRNILRVDQELVSTDVGRRCVPEYLAVLVEGTEVSDGIGSEGWVERDGPGPSAIQATMSLSVQAVSRMRSWSLDRRSFSAAMTLDANKSFDDDMIEVAERLQSYFIAPAARLAHQVQMLALTMEREYHWSSKHPLAKLLWGATSEPVVSATSDSHPEQMQAGNPSKKPKIRQYGETDADLDDAGTAFGLVVLISNRTARKTINELIVRLEGRRTVFLEDACGNALEAMGYGCHVGGESQSKCLRPTHAPYIVDYTGDREPGFRPRVAWRRHTATRSVAHAAREIGTSYWGAQADIWLADLRPSCACPGAVPLEHVVETQPHLRLHIVQKPEELWDLDQTMLSCSNFEDVKTDASVDWITSMPTPAPERALSDILAEYLTFHREGVSAMARGERDIPVLVYSCQPFAQCGGHGDRLNGIVTAFVLAVLTRRVFLIDYESPLPLQMVLTPHLIDWRVRGSIMATAGLRHHSYHDKRRQFEADISRLAEYPDEVLVVTKNYRMLRSLFEAPALRSRVTELGLPLHAPKFLVAEIFEVLFAPSPILQYELKELRSKLGGLQDRRFISIHLRTGNIAWDPERHGVAELSDFLACAKQAEEELGLPADTPWLLATDSANVAEAAGSLPTARSGKLRVPSAQGRIHIDRSDLSDVLAGTVANYAEYLLFGQAAAVVLSRSYFGETAAEIGRVPNAYFAPGGGCVRTDLSTS